MSKINRLRTFFESKPIDLVSNLAETIILGQTALSIGHQELKVHWIRHLY
jgi:hypothetical protein